MTKIILACTLIKYMKNSGGLSESTAILIGSILISFSILLSNGIIKIKGLSPSTGSAPTQAAVPTVPTQPTTPTAPAPNAPATASLGHLPFQGDKNAKVGVIEFADLRCPFCKRFFDDTEPSLLKDYVNTGKVKLAFRHFEFLGPASTVAGNAAECANDQGKFWDLYNYLYKNQPSESDTSMFTTDKLTPIATSLGMSGDQFKSCLDSKKFDANLNTDKSDGDKAGVTGTPSFIIGKLDGDTVKNGQLVVGAVPYEQIKSAIESALQ